MKIPSNDLGVNNKIDTIARTQNVSNTTEKPKVDIPQDKKAESEAKNPASNEKPHISEKVVIEAIEKANKAIEGSRTEFKFSIHKETHQIMVKVIDKDKNEVIREIPPKKVLDMVAKMWEMAGIIVDEKR